MNLRTVKWMGLNWTGNDHIVQSGAQDFVIEHMQQDQFPILSLTTTRRLWCAVTLEDLLRLMEKNRGIYEILIPGLPRKIYFDVDKTKHSLQEIKEMILKYFPNAEMHISGRTEPEQSYHIILGNYYADCLDDMLPVKRIALSLKDDGFDPSVYEKNKNFKCINQS